MGWLERDVPPASPLALASGPETPSGPGTPASGPVTPTSGSGSPAGAIVAAGPGLSPVAWLRLDPRSVDAERLVGGVVFAVVAAGSGVAMLLVAIAGSPRAVVFLCLVLWVLGLLGLGGLLWLQPERNYRNTRYRVTGQGIEIERGRLWHRQIAVARSRIQHSDVSQGPLDRRFGIAKLVLHTAGARHGMIELDGLPLESARSARAALVGLVDDLAV